MKRRKPSSPTQTKPGRRATAALAVLTMLAALIVAAPNSAATVNTSAPTALDPLDDGNGLITGVDVDENTGLFHVALYNNDVVNVYDAAGTLVDTYGGGILDGPVQTAMSGDRIYVTSGDDYRVEYFDRSTYAHLGGWGSSGSGPGEFGFPWGIAVVNNRVYVADDGNDRIQEFTLGGAYLSSFDGAGTPGEIEEAHMMAVHDGELYVVDSTLDRVVVFNPTTGTYVTGHTVPLTRPRGISISADGDMFISGTSDGNVAIVASNGTFTHPVVDADNQGIWVDPTGTSFWLASTDLGGFTPYTWNTCNGTTPTVLGTAYGDTFSTFGASDVVFAAGGDDDIDTGGGNDIICVGTGNDTVQAGTGADTVYGGTGNDEIHGGPGEDFLFGSSGNDTIYGDAGQDQIQGGLDNDMLYGGDTADTISGNAGNDTIYGGFGNDFLFGNDGDDILHGEGDNDAMYGGNDDDEIHGSVGLDRGFGQAGNDTLTGGDGDDRLYGGSGNDTIEGDDGEDRVYGQAGDDNVYGGNDNDQVYGGIDNDTLEGDNGNDFMYGQGGNDNMNGGANNDTMYGGAGEDTMHGNGQNDTIYGQGGNDDLYGDSGTDLCNGGAGNNDTAATSCETIQATP